MAILVDTNIIIDVLTDDPEWAEWSAAQLERLAPQTLVINPIVYAELCSGCASTAIADKVLLEFDLNFREIPREGLFRAAHAFVAYRNRGGKKQSVLPDFMIGGHAEATGMAVLTRDVEKMRTYFPRVQMLVPT